MIDRLPNTVAALLIPARCASKIDPQQALREMQFEVICSEARAPQFVGEVQKQAITTLSRPAATGPVRRLRTVASIACVLRTRVTAQAVPIRCDRATQHSFTQAGSMKRSTRTVPRATCASAEALSIASARKADAFASVNASWCGTTRNAACTHRVRAKPACAGA
jgi:hypothetical protein